MSDNDDALLEGLFVALAHPRRHRFGVKFAGRDKEEEKVEGATEKFGFNARFERKMERKSVQKERFKRFPLLHR